MANMAEPNFAAQSVFGPALPQQEKPPGRLHCFHATQRVKPTKPSKVFLEHLYTLTIKTIKTQWTLRWSSTIMNRLTVRLSIRTRGSAMKTSDSIEQQKERKSSRHKIAICDAKMAASAVTWIRCDAFNAMM